MKATSSRSPRTRSPGLLLALAAIGALLFVLPLVGLLVRAPWNDLASLISSPLVVDALRLSLISSVAAAALSLLLGVPLAWVLARHDFPGRRVVRALVTLPMVLPPVVAGAALLFAFGRRGTFGEAIYQATDFVLPFSLWGVILANLFVAMPFLVVTVEGALRSLDTSYEETASALGASPLRTFTRVALPLIRPSIVAGVVLAWARALGEFGATITFAGNLQGRTQTMPLAVSVALEADRDAAVAISLVLVAVSLIVLIALRDRWWSQ